MNTDRTAKTQECRCQQPKGRANNIYEYCKVLRGAKSPHKPFLALSGRRIGRSSLTSYRLCSSYDLATYYSEPTFNNKTLETKHKQHDQHVPLDTKDYKNRHEHQPTTTARNVSIANPPTKKTQQTRRPGQPPSDTQAKIDSDADLRSYARSTQPTTRPLAAVSRIPKKQHKTHRIDVNVHSRDIKVKQSSHPFVSHLHLHPHTAATTTPTIVLNTTPLHLKTEQKKNETQFTASPHQATDPPNNQQPNPGSHSSTRRAPNLLTNKHTT